MDLKALLKALDQKPGARLELMSGRRPRLVRGAELKNLADEILTDDEVIELCKQAGGGKRLDDLNERPLVWSMPTSAGPVSVTAMTKGREVAASFARPLESSLPPPKQSEVPSSRDAATRRGIKPVRRPSQVAPTRSKTNLPPAQAKTVPQQRKVTPPPQRKLTQPPQQQRRVSQAPKTDAGNRTNATKPDIQSARPNEPRQKPREAAPPMEVDRGPREKPRSVRPPADIGGPARPQQQAIVPPAPKSEPTNIDPHSRTADTVVTADKLGRRAKNDEQLLELLRDAAKRGASDLHLSAESPPFARTVQGLTAIGRRELSRPEVERLLHALVPDSLHAEISAKGGTSFSVSVGSSYRLRVNASVTLSGPKLAIRLLPSSPPTIEGLGLPKDIEQAIEHHQGLVVITGPTGQGKTTTLAALVDRINETRAAHIIVVEDPSEILFVSKKSVVSQREIGEHAKSFDRALTGALRQDPDVIVVGELRDVTTVRMALAASETGHLVLGTMNTPSAKSAIDRLIDLFPPGDQPQVRATLAGGLRMVTSQRLLPRADESGRVAAFEILPGSIALWNLIRDERTFQIGSLMQRGRGAGILRLADSLSDLVRSGAVTREAADAACDDLGELAELLDGKRPRPELPGSAGKPLRDAPGNPGDAPRPPEPEGASELFGSLINKAGALFGRRGNS